jgi:hypothetical protein
VSLHHPQELMHTLDFIAELCNRHREGTLETAAELRRFCSAWSFPGASGATKADAEATWAQVGTIEALWDADRDTAAQLANQVFDANEARPRLVRHGSFDWHLHGVPVGAPLPSAVVVHAAMAFVDLVRADDTARCKRCGDGRCERMFLDQSRNRSRRFCSTTCQSRTNVAAFRERRTAHRG